jgi:hypothetical protein
LRYLQNFVPRSSWILEDIIFIVPSLGLRENLWAAS